MSKNLIILGILAAGVVALVSFGDTQAKSMSGREFLDAYKGTPQAVLLDVRTPSEFAVGHIAGAVNMDFESPAFSSEMKALDKNLPYFLYCRSGNRSGQAITIMKREGFKNLSELRGGIIANQGLLDLVVGAASSSPEYVVDASDMLDGSAVVVGAPQTVLNDAEKDGLLRMREEEKLARDVYTTLGAKWGIKMFSNIAASEQTHTNAVKVLLDRYALSDPSSDDTVGVFRSSEMQALYQDLTTKGSRSIVDALHVGATVEDLDIRDLDILMKGTEKQDIILTYMNLQRGSRNHMRAFIKNLTVAGGTYAPQYISQDAFTAITSGQQERGGR